MRTDPQLKWLPDYTDYADEIADPRSYLECPFPTATRTDSDAVDFWAVDAREVYSQDRALA